MERNFVHLPFPPHLPNAAGLHYRLGDGDGAEVKRLWSACIMWGTGLAGGTWRLETSTSTLVAIDEKQHLKRRKKIPQPSLSLEKFLVCKIEFQWYFPGSRWEGRDWWKHNVEKLGQLLLTRLNPSLLNIHTRTLTDTGQQSPSFKHKSKSGHTLSQWCKQKATSNITHADLAALWCCRRSHPSSGKLKAWALCCF